MIEKIAQRRFLSDTIFLRMFKNASWLVSGNFLAAAIGFINVALSARILGVELFGIFVLITTYAAIIDRLVNFQVWQSLIRYGSQAIANKDNERFRRLIKFSGILDLGSALSGAAVGVILAPVVGALMGFDNQQILLLALFNLVTVTHWAGVPTAILRLYNRYRTLALQNTVSALIALIGLLIVWFHGGDLVGVILIYGISQICGNVFLVFNGLKVLHKSEAKGFASVPLDGVRAENPGILKFIVYTNIESSVKILRQLDVFIIKYLLSSEAVGFYRIARRLADMLTMAIDPFFHAIYPELTRLFAARDKARFEELMWRSSLLVGSGAVVALAGFIVCGEWFISAVFGADFANAYTVVVICIGAMVVWAMAQPLSPALYAIGYVNVGYYIHLLTAVLYLGLLYIMSIKWQIIGAALALLIFFFLWATSMVIAYFIVRKRGWNDLTQGN